MTQIVSPLVEAPHLTQLEVVMFGKHYVLSPTKDLAVSPSTLGDDLQAQPGLYAFYATLRDLAVAKVSEKLKELQRQEGILIHNWRADNALPSGVRVTEDGIKQALRADQYLQTLQSALIQAERERDMLSSIVNAFEHRRSVLNALATRALNSSIQDSDVDVYVTGHWKSVKTEALDNLKSSTRGRGGFPGTK